MNHLLFLAVVLWGCSALGAPPGDVNGDGAVDVADLYRARKIADGELAFAAAADVDGDAAVTDIDTWLIQEAVLGHPVPERVAGATIGPSGGTLAYSNIVVSVPPGSVGTRHLALFRCADTALDEATSLHGVYLLCGLATNLAGFSVTYTTCGEDTGLVVGSYLQPHDAGEPQWHWQALPESAFVRTGTQVSRSFPPPETSDLAVSHSLKLGLLTAIAPPPIDAPDSSAAVGPAIRAQELRAPGHRFAGYLYTGWISDKYRIYTKDWGTVSYTDLETVCGHLYAIHAKLLAMGFPLDTTHAARFPLDVYVIRGLKGDGGSVHNPVTGSHILEISAALLAHPSELKATVGHELMHYVLNEYTRGDAFAFESVEDAITTWFEAVAADNPTHLSGNHTVRRAAPLKGLFCPITRGWTGMRNWSAQEQHGYGTSAFVDYCFDDHPGWIHDLAQEVQGGRSAERALHAVFTDKLGALQGLERRYLQFARDYLMTETNCYSASIYPQDIFNGDACTDLSAMYTSIAIKKATTNLLEEQEVNLTVQDYGCGIVAFQLYKPKQVFAPHTSLRVSAPARCRSVDLLLHYKDSNRVRHRDIVTGTFGPNAEGEDEWSCVIELPEDSDLVRIFALAVVGNEGALSNYTEEHDITLTYQFVGDYYMPMQECFISCTELSSANTFYDRQVYADATFRIVDPSRTAGLEYFTVDRDTIAFSAPAHNYAIRTAFSLPGGVRRTPDAFQIRLFSDARVPELPPFTINIAPDGYSPWTHDGQTPVMAADGSPRMELMVYHYPQSAIDQVVPGQPAYRTQHLVTSVHDLKQSEDGQSGGILVDVPAQIDGYQCVIYLFACEEGESLGHTAFAAVIFARTEEDP